MKIHCVLVSDSAHDFFPLKYLTKSLGDDPIWMTVNYGVFPPIELLGYLGVSNFPGIDGQNIELNINPLTVNLNRGDILSINKFNLYLKEILH